MLQKNGSLSLVNVAIIWKTLNVFLIVVGQTYYQQRSTGEQV